MSERGAFRGGGASGRGSGPSRGGAGRGGGRGGGTGSNSAPNSATHDKERPKKESILDLSKYVDKRITVKFSGGREVVGTLKGYDLLMNLVLDDVDETLRDEENNIATRPLGLLVARGTLLTSIAPLDGSEEIANPFVNADEDA